MIKILDMDKIFDKYISDYVYSNIGKINPDEIENQIPLLYNEFGDKPLAELDGKTPNEYYKGFSGEELLDCLKQHLANGVSVSDFLCEALQSDIKHEPILVKELSNDNDEEYTLYLMNILSVIGSTQAKTRYLQFITWDYSEPIKELATEILCEMSDQIKDEILAIYQDSSKEVKAYLTQILSYCKQDDRVFEILINEFLNNLTDIPIYCNYLARYGDDKALPFLLTAIENEKINYQEFQELRYAIEALGGEYTKTRDFSADKIYKKIKSLKEGK